MSANLIPALGSTALLGALIRPVLVLWLVSGLWLALVRTPLPLARRRIVWGTVAESLVAWLVLDWTLALNGAFELATRRLIVGSDVVLVATVLTLLIRSKSFASAIDAAPAWWLLGAQAYRVAGFLFLRLWAAGILPGSFALPAGIGDGLTGLGAIVAAVALWRNKPWARGLAYGVNLFGIADLINAVALGALSAASGAGPSPLTTYPLAMVPTFGVPLGFIVHCLSLWQLLRQGRSSRQSQRVAVIGATISGG